MKSDIFSVEVETIPEAALRQATVRKEQSVLLVIDMQNYFREIVESIIPNLISTLEVCRKAGVPVIYTQHGFDDPDAEAGMLGEWWGDHIVVGTENWEFIPETAPLGDETVIRKMRYNAFHGTDLETWFRKLGVKNVIIGGVMTNLCCETTARDAFVRDYRVFFLTDGTATVSSVYQQATLRNLAYGFAHLKRCEEIVEELTRHTD